ncbi:response regulator [Phormidium tenue FACHB-886]|nr:response regulator [Phormidium tenue FACHB-886]
MSSALSEPTSRRFRSLERPPKPKMLVVDDEPDNLDLLYRTFRRDFNVLRAENGLAALSMLAEEGEVAVIISDQRMPEMRGTEFLSRTVPQFPDTMRIILTGFTDVEDLVEAINSGQVYKYITKPWEPNELKIVVQRAAETYELLKHRTEELRRAQAQTTLLSTIAQVASQATQVADCLQPIADACTKVFGADRCILQIVTNAALGAVGANGMNGSAGDWLSHDSFAQEAIASQKIQGFTSLSVDATLASLPQYADAGIQAHLVAPVVFRNQVLALLSLQWGQPCPLQEDELALIELSVQQIGIALACVC